MSPGLPEAGNDLQDWANIVGCWNCLGIQDAMLSRPLHINKHWWETLLRTVYTSSVKVCRHFEGRAMRPDFVLG